MKNCPNGCGVFDDYETKCPVCGSKLIRVKGAPGTRTSGASGNAASRQQTAPNYQTGGGYHFGASGTQGTSGTQGASGNQGASGTQGASGNQGASGARSASGSQGPSGSQGGTGSRQGFAYDMHIYGQPGPDPFNHTQAGAAGNTVPVQPGNQGIFGEGKRIRGRVKNLREDFVPMSLLGNVFYSAVHRANVKRNEEMTNFQLIEYDRNDNQTGRVYSVTLRGKVVAGHFYEGNTVIVEGRQGRGGEINAKNIYNESAGCTVRYRRNKTTF